MGLPCAAPKTPEKSGELRFSCRDVTSSLIELGADIEARTELGATPLHLAVSENSLDVARLLIDSGANTEGIDLNWMN